MKFIVLGLVALVSTGVRASDDLNRDWHAQLADERQVLLPRVAADGMATEPGAVFSNQSVPGDGEETTGTEMSSSDPAPGEWETACQMKSGSALMFDRASLREYGAVTLFRWSAPRAHAPVVDERVFTGVANCREKTIEASWPGKSRETHAGTCGRGLVEAVCAAAGQAVSPAKARRPSPPSATARGSSAERLPHRQ